MMGLGVLEMGTDRRAGEIFPQIFSHILFEKEAVVEVMMKNVAKLNLAIIGEFKILVEKSASNPPLPSTIWL